MVKKRIKEQPFVRWRIPTTAGESYVVHHPDMVLVDEREVHVGISSKKSPSIDAQVNRIALMHSAALEDLPVAPKAGSKGQDAS